MANDMQQVIRITIRLERTVASLFVYRCSYSVAAQPIMLLKLFWGSVQRLSVGRLSHQCAKLTKSLLRLKAMLYMVIEYFNAGAAVEIYRRARNRGRQLPPGLEYVDSWVI